MGNFGDFFSKKDKNKYIDRHLKDGQVLYLFCKFKNLSKEKYLVLISPGSNPLLFIINSKIHPFIAEHPHLSKCQVMLKALDYPFLDHDSYINCSEVIEWFDNSQIRKQILGDISRIRGGRVLAKYTREKQVCLLTCQ